MDRTMVEPKERKKEKEKEKEREKTPVFFRADAHGKMYRRRFIKRREGFCTDFAPLPPRTFPPPLPRSSLSASRFSLTHDFFSCSTAEENLLTEGLVWLVRFD